MGVQPLLIKETYANNDYARETHAVHGVNKTITYPEYKFRNIKCFISYLKYTTPLYVLVLIHDRCGSCHTTLCFQPDVCHSLIV